MIEYSDEDIGFEEDMYDKLFDEDLRIWDNIDAAFKEAFLKGRDYERERIKKLKKNDD